MFDEENAVIKSLQKGERSNRNGKSEKKKVESKSVKKIFANICPCRQQQRMHCNCKGCTQLLAPARTTQTKYRKIITGVVNYDRFIIIMTQNISHTIT